MDPTSESDREATAPPVRSTPRPSLQPMLPLPLLCLLALLLAPMGEARYLLVGNYSSADNSWSQFTDYGQWEKENPLYVGDVVSEYHQKHWAQLLQRQTGRNSGRSFVVMSLCTWKKKRKTIAHCGTRRTAGFPAKAHSCPFRF